MIYTEEAPQVSQHLPRFMHKRLANTYAIPEPIARCAQSHSFGSNGKLKDFSDNDPGGRTPRAGKEEHIEADEDNQTVIRGFGIRIHGPDGGNDKFAHRHCQGTIDQ